MTPTTGVRAGEAPAAAWRPTPALLTGVTFVLGCLLLAVLARRPDLVAVAVPVFVGLVLALLRVPPDDLEVRVALTAPSGGVFEGDDVGLTAHLEVDGEIDAAVLDVAPGDAGGGLTFVGDQVQVVLPRPGEPLAVGFDVTAERWGRWIVGPLTVGLVAAEGLLRRPATASSTVLVSVVPLRGAFDATDALPHASGMVGPHRSHRPGDGSDLLSLRPFVAGDRLRRITWPASLRTGRLHVVATTDDRDADIELVLDTWADVGIAADPVGTALDAGVRAAASIAEHYLRRGDRVGLVDVGRPARPVRVAAGRRHLQLVLGALLSAKVRAPDPDDAARALSRLRPRSLVIILTTLLDEPIGRHIAALAQSGRTVLVVDTLPADVQVPSSTVWTPLAWRLALLRRATVIESLAERGVPVARWQGARSLDVVLRQLSVAARAARRGR